MKLMPSCREVRERLTELDEGAVPGWERLALRFHLLICSACHGFHLGLRALPGVARRLLEHPAGAPPAEAVQALEQVLKRIAGKTG